MNPTQNPNRLQQYLHQAYEAVSLDRFQQEGKIARDLAKKTQDKLLGGGNNNEDEEMGVHIGDIIQQPSQQQQKQSNWKDKILPIVTTAALTTAGVGGIQKYMGSEPEVPENSVRISTEEPEEEELKPLIVEE